MTTIQIRKDNKKLVKEYCDGSFDAIINQLIDDVGDYMPVTDVMDSPVTTMRLNEDTVNLLSSFKLTPNESYEYVILRLLLLAKTLNSIDD